LTVPNFVAFFQVIG